VNIELGGSNELVISGNMKSIEDSTKIKESVNALKKNGSNGVVLRIQDSFSMTSTVIGFLMKLVNVDKVRVSLIVGDPRLYQLLDELCLVPVFNVRLVER
jgi:hypothetical protein